MTAGLALGAEAKIYPLSGQVPPGLTPLRQVHAAGTVRVTSKTQGKHEAGSITSGGKPRDWLTLLVKEELGRRLRLSQTVKIQADSSLSVDLKYVTGKQKFTLEYEGGTNVFEINAISSQSCRKNTPNDLVPRLEKLGIDPALQIWTVGWDTSVAIVSADTLKPPESAKVQIIFSLSPVAHIGPSKRSWRAQTHMLQLAVWTSRYRKYGISSIFR
jgi:AAA family ATPase